PIQRRVGPAVPDDRLHLRRGPAVRRRPDRLGQGKMGHAVGGEVPRLGQPFHRLLDRGPLEVLRVVRVRLVVGPGGGPLEDRARPPGAKGRNLSNTARYRLADALFTPPVTRGRAAYASYSRRPPSRPSTLGTAASSSRRSGQAEVHG